MNTVQELADFFKCDYRTILRWIEAGKIDAKKFGKRYLISDSEFDRIKNEGVNHKAG